MIGEVALGGVYLPALLVLAGIALFVTALLTRLLAVIGAYRFIAYRPLFDLALTVVVLGVLVVLTRHAGTLP